MSKTRSGKRIIKRAFDRFALILGFIVDLITVVSILLAIDSEGSKSALPNFITPGLAFVIWLLAGYTYLAFLHTYWSSHKTEKDLAETFGGFLGIDLILRFRSPWLMFPGLVSVVLLVWMTYSLEPALLPPVSALIVVAVVVAVVVRIASSVPSRNAPSVSEQFKKQVEENWGLLEDGIQYRLAEEQWVHFYELGDIATVWGVDLESMSYVLAKYAVEHPDMTRYGQLYIRGTDVPLSSDSVLINLQTVNRDDCYWV